MPNIEIGGLQDLGLSTMLFLMRYEGFRDTRCPGAAGTEVGRGTRATPGSFLACPILGL